jgi:hypothetical protein
MAEEQDAKVSAAYRALAAEEPPRALDDAILAASRRALRPWTQRYAVPLGLAAVLVLSVTVTLRMQYEQPGIESPANARKDAVAMAPAPVAQEPLKLKPEQQIKLPPPRAKSAPAGEPKPFADMPREQAAAKPAVPAAAPAPAAAAAGSVASHADRMEAGRNIESSVAGASARQAEERTSRDAEAAARAPQVGPLRALAKSSAEAPETELERIAQLRRDGKHDEADKALAEFRKRFPDYKMTDAMRERVERR